MQAISKIDQMLMFPGLKNVFINRRIKMLNEKIDVSAFLIWFLENYPQSVERLSESPTYQNRFISGVKQKYSLVYFLTE
jgi:hypothetical protein